MVASVVNETDFTAVKESKKALQIAAIKRNQEVLELKAKIQKDAVSKKSEAIKMTDGLRKSKQELLEKLIEEQKKEIWQLKQIRAENEKNKNLVEGYKRVIEDLSKNVR